MHQAGKNKPIWCVICDEEVRMIQAEKAATVCRCSRRKIYRWVEEGQLHFIEMPGGDVLVCGRSLSLKMEELDSSTHKLTSDYETR
jgi:excisionase family DNA binding protein